MARSQHLHKEKENLNISRALVEYIQQVLKATGQDQIPHELGEFKKAALQVLDKIEIPNPDRSYQLQNIELFKSRLGRIPEGYRKILDDFAQNTDNLASTEKAFPSYVSAINMVGFDKLTPEAKANLESYMTSDFQMEKFLKDLESSRLSNRQAMEQFNLLEYLEKRGTY